MQHEIVMRPVGVVHSDHRELSWGTSDERDSWETRVRREQARTDAVARLEIDPGLDGILDGIEEYSHAMVLWWPDRNQSRYAGATKVHPMGRDDFPEVGLFATRSPRRPNSILATVVEVVEHRGDVLEVKGLDAIDGTPILDIKPVTPGDCPTGELRVPDWLAQAHREFAEQNGR